MVKRLALLLLLCPPALARADEFDGKKDLGVDELAKIQAERVEKQRQVDEKLKDDSSPEARRQKAEAYQQIDREVAERNGVTEKDLARREARASPAERKEVADKSKAIEAEHAKEAEAKKQAAQPGEPEVIQGFNDAKPLDMTDPSEKSAEKKEKPAPKLDADGNPIPEVEQSIDPKDAPPDADADQPADAPPEPAPEPAAGKHGGHHR